MSISNKPLKRYRCVVEREYSQETGKVEHNATFYPDDKGVWVLYSDVEDLFRTS